jgi:hypothetical protein
MKCIIFSRDFDFLRLNKLLGFTIAPRCLGRASSGASSGGRELAVSALAG